MSEPSQPNRRSWMLSSKMMLTLIILLGTWLRLGAALETVVDHPIRADAADYVAAGYNLRHFSTYSTEWVAANAPQPPTANALREPGYPAFLTLYLGHAPDWNFIRNVLLAQALLGIAIIPVVYRLATNLMPARWALLPALLIAMSPKLVTAGTYLLTETLFTTLLVAAIACIAWQCKRTERRWLPLLGGLLLGLATLTRPTTQYILPFILLAILPSLPRQYRWHHAGGLLVGFALAVVPWAVRNIMIIGHASDPTLAINTLIHGHYPWMMYDARPETLGYPYRFDPQVEQLSSSIGAAVKGILQRIQQSPGEYLQWYLLGKPVAFLSWADPAASREIFTYPTLYSPYYNAPAFIASLILAKTTHWVWVVLCIAATALALRPQAKATPILRLLAATFAYFVLLHMAGFPIARYNIPLLPVIFVLAGYALHTGVGTLRMRATSPGRP